MKCLSLWQSWASLLVHGAKRVETRSWPIKHRGPLLIHAAKKWNGELAALAKSDPFCAALRAMGATWSDTGRPTIPFGAIVGRVDVTGCYPTAKIFFAESDDVAVIPWDGGIQLPTSERPFGDYSADRFAFLCANPVAFTTPIPCPGRQGLFNVPDSVVAGVKAIPVEG